MHLYTLRNIQYTEVESNRPPVSNREEFRLYPLKSREDSTFLLLCSLALCHFKWNYCFCVHLFFVSSPFA